ncbi:SET domain-containing protein [Hysterangium stoloniferum]|nr:SET domain-containing protein [Hysterangium stoloniferum]
MQKPNPKFIRLDSHATARNAAVATESLSAGVTVLSTLSLSSVLLESEKRRRCDGCFRQGDKLHRCTGCKQYWYCDAVCQLKSWKAHHQHLCIRLKAFTASDDYRSASASSRLHYILLAHVLAENSVALQSMFDEMGKDGELDIYNPISALLSLLPAKQTSDILPNFPMNGLVPESLIAYLACRFANNNFTIHTSWMDVFAHGVFPVASRLFNHSCVPSAVPVYKIQDASTIQMDVKLLRDLNPGDEITIPYIDPALPYTVRRDNLAKTYDFTCNCPLCHSPFDQVIEHGLAPAELTSFESRLHQRILPLIERRDSLIGLTKANLALEFLASLHQGFLPSISEAFSVASHYGSYSVAVQKGQALLAFYYLIYPANYPMIGLHALELAKTHWNGWVTNSLPRSTLEDMKRAISLAEDIFHMLYGASGITGTLNGDAEPLSELKALKKIWHGSEM